MTAMMLPLAAEGAVEGPFNECITADGKVEIRKCDGCSCFCAENVTYITEIADYPLTVRMYDNNNNALNCTINIEKDKETCSIYLKSDKKISAYISGAFEIYDDSSNLPYRLYGERPDLVIIADDNTMCYKYSISERLFPGAGSIVERYVGYLEIGINSDEQGFDKKIGIRIKLESSSDN